MDARNTPPAFDTVIEALNWLRSEGYTYDFNVDCACVRSNDGDILSPDDFSIRYVFRFEGDSNPDDESIVYGIASDTDLIKGVMVNAFGMYADNFSTEMIKKLYIHKIAKWN